MSEVQPLFLSRLTLDLACKDARRMVADVYEAHRVLLQGFGALCDDDRILWRWEPTDAVHPILLIQSTLEPDWDGLPNRLVRAAPEVKSIHKIAGAITQGRSLAFALTANASRKVDTKSTPEGARRNGRRVPLRRFDDQVQWLVRQASSAGFEIMTNRLGRPEVRIGAPTRLSGRRGEHVITVEAVRFEGALSVKAPEQFLAALRSGIGPARAFGCGLLTVAPLG